MKYRIRGFLADLTVILCMAVFAIATLSLLFFGV